MDDSLRYTSDKVAIVREARKRGISDEEILSALCQNETANSRRKIVKEWAAALGLTEEEALQTARGAGLIRP